MRYPAVSVVIPTHNRAHLVVRAVTSALDQLRPDDEIIVIDDASKDNTAEVLAPFADRIRYLPVAHGGAGAARNHGIRVATRPLIAFLDSDDEWFPNKLALQRGLHAARPDVLYSFTNFSARNHETIEPHYLRIWHRDPRPWDEILAPGVPYSSIAPLPTSTDDPRVHIGSMYYRELFSDYVATTTLVVRRVEAGAALHFAEDLPVAEDKECFARLAGAGLAAYLDCDTSYQWEHLGPRLTTQTTLFDQASARLVIMDRVWAKDSAFLAEHGEAFARKKREHHLMKAQCLLVLGRMPEARKELTLAGPPIPWSFRCLAALPGPVVQALLTVRRLFR